MQLVSVDRITNLPVVKSSLGLATKMYFTVKKSNRLFEWSFGTAEGTVVIAFNITKPTVILFEGPIHLIDDIVCKSLDLVETTVPFIRTDPEKLYLATKEYVTAVVDPMLKRADSVKELSVQTALTYSNKAAESVDNALTLADGYVNKYLPEIAIDSAASTQPASPIPASPEPQNQTEKTIRHVNKFSRTLKRRLTQRTIYEARELKKQGVNLIHALVKLTDLLARDPKAFAEKMQDLWHYLSKDEPENQAPPSNMEQLIVMLTREGARRFVHMVNFTATTSVQIPTYAKQYIHLAFQKFEDFILGLDLSSKNGIKRHIDLLKMGINNIIDTFFSLLKVGSSSSKTPKRIPLQSASRGKKQAEKVTNNNQTNSAATESVASPETEKVSAIKESPTSTATSEA